MHAATLCIGILVNSKEIWPYPLPKIVTAFVSYFVTQSSHRKSTFEILVWDEHIFKTFFIQTHEWTDEQTDVLAKILL